MMFALMVGSLLAAAPVAPQAPAVPGSTASRGPSTQGDESGSQSGIQIDISGMTNDKGAVRCVLFASEKGFPGDYTQGIEVVSVVPAQGKAVCRFHAPKVGTYAVSVLHDENSNGKMDGNFLGIPWEGVGCTRDASSPMGPPHFDDSKFSYPGGFQRLPVHVKR